MRCCRHELHELGPCAQPHPFTASVAHAERPIDRAVGSLGELSGNVVEAAVFGVHQRVDLAEGEQLFARGEADDFKHGIRPIDSASRQIPVPQPAPAAIERGVHAFAHPLVDFVCFACPRRLPMKSKSEDQQHEASGRDQGDSDCGIGTPAFEGARLWLERGDLPQSIGQLIDRGQQFRAVREGELERIRAVKAHAGVGLADKICEPLVSGQSGGGRRRDHTAAGVGDIETAVDTNRTPRQGLHERGLNLSRGGVFLDPAREMLAGRGRKQRQLILGVGEFLPPMVENLHCGSDRDRRQERDNQDWNRAPQQWLGLGQAQIGGTAEGAG